MYLVTKTYGHDLGLSACFRQWRAKSHCRFLHGYPLSFKLTFAAEKLDENNWVIDFGGLKSLKAWLVDNFDHKLLVAEDDPELELFEILAGRGLRSDCGEGVTKDPVVDMVVVPFVGCEGFAEYVFDYASTWLREAYPDAVYPVRTGYDVCRGLRLVEVEVREHGGNSAIYRNV